MAELFALSNTFICLMLLVLSNRSEQREILRYENEGFARMEKGTPGSSVTGEFSWMDDKGEKKTIIYVADERGFRAYGDSIPGNQWTRRNGQLKMPKIGSSVVPVASSSGRTQESKVKAEVPNTPTQAPLKGKQIQQPNSEQQQLEQQTILQQQNHQELLRQQQQIQIQQLQQQLEQLKQLQTIQTHKQQKQQQQQQPQLQQQLKHIPESQQQEKPHLHSQPQQQQELHEQQKQQQQQEQLHEQQQQQQIDRLATKNESLLSLSSDTRLENEIKTNIIPNSIGEISKTLKKSPKPTESLILNHLNQNQQLDQTPKRIPGTSFILLSHMRLPLKDTSVVPKVQEIRPIPVEATGEVHSTITGLLSAPRAINVLGNKMGKRLSSIPDPVVRKTPTPSKVEGMLNLDNFLRPAHITSSNQNQTPNPLQNNYDYYYYDYYYDHQPNVTNSGGNKQLRKQASNKQSRTQKERPSFHRQRKIRSEESIESFEDFDDISEEERGII